MRIKSLVLALALTAPALNAQEGGRPEGWKVRFDRASASDADLTFVTMSPGWHITTGPAGIFYNPSNSGTGEYRVESTIFLFDPGRRHREAYGIIFGGHDLEGEGQAYNYFLIRDTGEFLIKRRNGGSTETVVPWTPTSAIMPFPGGDEQAKNVLAIECGAETVDFFINGEKVTSVPRSQLDTDGVVGFRVNHGLNLHVTGLTVESK